MRMENSSWFNREELVAWCEIWNKQINKEEKVEFGKVYSKIRVEN